MIDAMIYDVVPRAGVIDLGKQVEGLVTRVVLPNIRRGAGIVQLVHQRSDDQKPYLVPVTEDGESVYWLVSRADTAFPGRGQAELQWLGENGAVAKSATYQTNTTRSMTEPGPEPDEPLRPYTQAVARDAQAAKDASKNATEAARSAEASAGQAGLSAATAVEAARNAEAIAGQAGQSAQSAQASALAAAQNAAAAETAEAGAKQAQTGAEAAKTEAQTAKTAAEKAAQEAKTAQAEAVEAKTGAETAQAKAEEAARGVAEDREQIGANTAGLKAAQQDVTALKASTARTARSLDYLWKKSKGIVYDTETVTGAGSSVTVPSGAMDYAALRMVGGVSRKGRNLLDITRYTPLTTPANAITTTVDSNAIIFTVPVIDETWQAWRIKLSDIGSGTYVVTANIDSTDADFTPNLVIYADNGDTITAISGLTASGAKTVTVPDGSVMRLYFHATTNSGANVARTVRYTNVMISKTASAYEPYSDSLLDAPVDAVRVANAAGDNTDTYPIPQVIRDLCPDYGQGTAESYNYVDFAAKAYYHVGSMAQDGTWTALATPEIIDLSAVWPNDDFGVLQVEAGGTINLHYPALDDGFELAVPSETEIMVDVAKVVQTNG